MGPGGSVLALDRDKTLRVAVFALRGFLLIEVPLDLGQNKILPQAVPQAPAWGKGAPGYGKGAPGYGKGIEEPLDAWQNKTLRVAVLDRATGKPILEYPPRTPLGQHFALSPDGRILAVAQTLAEPISLWELATGRQFTACVAKWPDGPLRPLVFSADGKRLLAESGESRLLLFDLKPRGRAGGAVAGQEPERLWDALAGLDGAAAYRAMWVLADAGPRTVTFLKARLRPAGDDSHAWLRRLVADLDSRKFAVREAAAKQLRELGPEITPFLRQALAAKPPLEMQRRLKAILAALPPMRPQDRQPDVLLGEPLRTVRAIQVLEWIGTPEAREVLQSLARGAPTAQETQHAKVSLQRLGLQ